MTAKLRGRVETLALRVVPPGGSTVLVLRSRTEPKGPLGGYEVWSHPPGSKVPVLLGLTNRQGRLVVPPDAVMLRVLLVKSGDDLLAKLPVVPGLEPQVTAELANHERRLEAEGFLAGLQEELVDLVARRKILMALIHMRMEAGLFNEAAEKMEELNKLDKALKFTMRISQQQDRLVCPDKSIQKKIDTMLTDTRQLIEKHLGNDEIEALDRELAPPGTRPRAKPRPSARPRTKARTQAPARRGKNRRRRREKTFIMGNCGQAAAAV